MCVNIFLWRKCVNHHVDVNSGDINVAPLLRLMLMHMPHVHTFPSDRERIDEAAEELNRILADDLLRHACLLVFANKCDLPGTVSAKELAVSLGLIT